MTIWSGTIIFTLIPAARSSPGFASFVSEIRISMEPTELLSCRDVSLGYERQSVLTYLSLTIRAGDYLCIAEAENDTYDIPQTVSYIVSAEDGGTFSISYAHKQYSLTYNLNAEDATWGSEPGVKSYRLGAALKLLTQLQASHFDVKILLAGVNLSPPCRLRAGTSRQHCREVSI